MPFICSICGEESMRICVRCTKDACSNHLCEKCQRCSDCCECELALTDSRQVAPAGSARSVLRAVVASRPEGSDGDAFRQDAPGPEEPPAGPDGPADDTLE